MLPTPPHRSPEPPAIAPVGPGSEPPHGQEPPRPTAIVMGSGKGGVGKSVLCVILAAALAQRGRRVLLLDGAQNLGNLHVLLGRPAASHLDGLLSGAVRAAELVTPVADNLWLVPCDSGTEAVYALSAVDRARLHVRLSALYDDFDVVVVDAGPGIDGVVRASAMRATRLIVVTLAESTALTAACALIKIVNLQVPSVPIGVIANRTLNPSEGESAFHWLRMATRDFQPRELTYLGSVPEDAAMREAVRRPDWFLGAGSLRSADAVRRMVDEQLDPLVAGRCTPLAVEETQP